MREFTKMQYARYLVAKRESFIKRLIYIFGVSLLLMISAKILVNLVKLNVVNTSPEVQEYLLKTLFYNFSTYELRQILLLTTGTASRLQTLLYVYWGYYFCSFFPITVMFWVNIVVKKFKPHEKGITAIHKIRKAVQDSPKTLTSKQKIRVRRAIRYGSFYKGIVPLSNNWLKKPEHQWFSVVINTHETKTIIYTLSKLDYVFLSSIANFPKDLSPFLDSLNVLEYFYFLVAARVEKDKFKIIDLNKGKKTEFDLLLKFANQIRPIVFLAKKQEVSAHKEGFKKNIGNFVLAIWQDEIIRQVGSISGIAATIMLLGVLIFKIDITQAFLTWFTATFGSLSVSVGLSKINKRKVVKQDKSEEKNGQHHTTL